MFGHPCHLGHGSVGQEAGEATCKFKQEKETLVSMHETDCLPQSQEIWHGHVCWIAMISSLMCACSQSWGLQKG